MPAFCPGDDQKQTPYNHISKPNHDQRLHAVFNPPRSIVSLVRNRRRLSQILAIIALDQILKHPQSNVVSANGISNGRRSISPNTYVIFPVYLAVCEEAGSDADIAFDDAVGAIVLGC